MKSVSIFAMIVLLMAGCKQSTPLIVGKWKVDLSEMSSVEHKKLEAATLQQARDTSLEFKSDGTYAIDIMGMHMDGTYTVDGDRVMLQQDERHHNSIAIPNEGTLNEAGDTLTLGVGVQEFVFTRAGK